MVAALERQTTAQSGLKQLGLGASSGLSPEQQVIVDCLRRALVPQSQAAPSARMALDWGLVARLAIAYGVAPVVHCGLAVADLPVPASALSALRAAYLGGVLRNKVCVEPTLHRVLGILHSGGFDPIVLKGAALGYSVYQQPAHRTVLDVDLLLPAVQLGQACATLAEAGVSTRQGDGYPPYHVRLSDDSVPGVTVELHRHLFPDVGRYLVDLEEILGRARVATVAGVETRVLAASDALHHTCVHMAHNHHYTWFPMRALADILAITASPNSGLDWGLFVDVVVRSRTSGAVYWPLWLSHRWLEAPIPATVLQALAPRTAIRKLIAAIAQPSYILDGQQPSRESDGVLYALLVDLSLYTGCSAETQVEAVLRRLFPRPDGVTHLPHEVARSRFRFGLWLGSPSRAIRGLAALWRLALDTRDS